MSIEVLPLGVRCQLKCTYCYQENIRTAGNEGDPRYDMAAMKRALEAEGYRFAVFGGEPLLMPLDDLRELFRWGMERFGAAAAKHGDSANAIQTNGALITDEHIRLFRKFQVGVGMSIDGPDELNDARSAGSLEDTRAATKRSLDALGRLLDLRLGVSLIVTLHRLNASPERLPRLLEWFRALAARGLRNVNLHLLEVDMPGVRESLSLTDDENVQALLACARLQAEIPMSFRPLTDMVHLLRGEDQWDKDASGRFSGSTSCTWNACDPYTTDAVHGVNGQGERGNCGRTCKEGPFWLKADTPGFERYLALAHTPQAFGGCQGCRFFYACKGHCPGEGEGGDWRAKTEHCGVLMRVFEALEGELARSGERPMSLSTERAPLEAALLASWQAGHTITITKALEVIRARGVASSLNARQFAAPSPSHGDGPHGDAPHGDHTDAERPIQSHGDHTDQGGSVAWAAL